MMAIITGDTSDLPTPQSRQEKYLKEIAYHSGGGGLKEVTTVEELESKLIKDNEGNVYHYSGETSGDYVKGNLYQVKTVNKFPYFVYYGYIPVYMINVTTENVTADPDNLPIIRPDGSVTLTFTADGEDWAVPYSAPAVTGADSVYIRVSDTEATITLTNPTADIEVEVVGEEPIFDGLFDANGAFIVSYADSGLKVESDYSEQTYTSYGSGYSTFNRYPDAKKIILPSGITKIGAYVFMYCAFKLEAIAIPNTVTSIGMYAFRMTYGLKSVTIPNGVKTIDYGAFRESYVKSVVFEGTPTSINSSAFSSTSFLKDIYVPWAQGAVSGAPWGATNATIHYNWTPTT